MLLRAQESVLKNLAHISASRFATPKFWQMSRWPRIIEKYGSANYLSTGFGESSHALLKEAAEYTNSRGKAAVDAQVCLDMHQPQTLLC